MEQPFKGLFMKSRFSLQRLSFVGGIAGLVATGFNAAEGLHWFPSLFHHFSLQAGLLLVIASITVLWQKKWQWAAVFLCCSLFNLSKIIDFHQPNPVVQPGPKAYKMVTINIQFNNHDHDRTLRYVKSQNADFLLLVEASSKWRKSLKPLDALYPHSLLADGGKHYDMMFYSKYPFHSRTVFFSPINKDPTFIASLLLDGKEVFISGVHIRAPFGKMAEEAKSALAHIAARPEFKERYSIIAGDFNATPWAGYFQDFKEKTGLFNAANGRHLIYTWPSILPFLGIPIDHVLHSPGIAINHFEKGPSVGSDHFPLVVDFSLSPEPPEKHARHSQ